MNKEWLNSLIIRHKKTAKTLNRSSIVNQIKHQMIYLMNKSSKINLMTNSKKKKHGWVPLRVIRKKIKRKWKSKI